MLSCLLLLLLLLLFKDITAVYLSGCVVLGAPLGYSQVYLFCYLVDLF